MPKWQASGGGGACTQRSLTGRNSLVMVVCVWEEIERGGGFKFHLVQPCNCLKLSSSFYPMEGQQLHFTLHRSWGSKKCQSASMFMCVYVYILWVRTAVAGCANLNIVTSQTGPVTTYWARFWVPQKSLNSQKPQGSGPYWSDVSCDSSGHPRTGLSSKAAIFRKESEDSASVGYGPNSWGQGSVLALFYIPLRSQHALSLWWAVGHCLLLASLYSSMHLPVMNGPACRQALLKTEMFWKHDLQRTVVSGIVFYGCREGGYYFKLSYLLNILGPWANLSSLHF